MTTLESLHGLLEEMGLKEEANSVQELSQEMEERIQRAQEESKDLQDALQRQLKGAALAELERQQVASAVATTTPSVPWLSSRSSSGFSSSSIKRKGSSNSSDSEKGNRNNPLRQVVVINELSHSMDHHDGIDIGHTESDLRAKSYDLNAVLNDEILFSNSVDEESPHHIRTGGIDVTTPSTSPMGKAGGGWYSDLTPKHLGSWSFDHEADSIENGGIRRATSGNHSNGQQRFQTNYSQFGKAPRGNSLTRADSKGYKSQSGANRRSVGQSNGDVEDENALPSGNTCIIA